MHIQEQAKIYWIILMKITTVKNISIYLREYFKNMLLMYSFSLFLKSINTAF